MLKIIIIFVFDPLAISLVIAANFAFDKAKPKKNLYGEEEWDEDHALDQVLNEIVDEKTTYNYVDAIRDIEVRDAQEVKPPKVSKEKKEVKKEEEKPTPPDRVKTGRPFKVLDQTSYQIKVQEQDGTIKWVNKKGVNSSKRYL